jgi:glucose dehydrogenase
MDRHGGNAFAIPLTAPADLYSNSTVALNPDTGKLQWYYQHLPGDDGMRISTKNGHDSNCG